jgi:hypothetical protein
MSSLKGKENGHLVFCGRKCGIVGKSLLVLFLAHKNDAFLLNRFSVQSKPPIVIEGTNHICGGYDL